MEVLAKSLNTMINTLADIKVGMDVPCVIRDILSLKMIVVLGAHVKAQVHVTEVDDTVDEKEIAKEGKGAHPFDKFKVICERAEIDILARTNYSKM